jgi:hypothetical protein
MNHTSYPDQGQAIRQPASAIFGIDSADRYTFDNENIRIDTQPAYKFSLYKGQSVLDGFIKRMALTEVNMEWNVPNVNTYNNKFALGIQGPDVSGGYYQVNITVPTGFYTPSELVEYLEDAVATDISNANPFDLGKDADIVFTLDSKTLYLTIECDTTDDIFISIPILNNGPDILNCTMYEMLGLSILLTSQVAALATPFTKIVGSYPSYLYTRYIDIVSENLTKKQDVKDSSTQPPEQGGSNLLARVYIAHSGLSESRFDISGVGCNIVGTRPFQLYKEFKTPKYIYWDGREFINLIDIKVYDDMGRPLYEQITGVIEDEEENILVSGNTAEFQITILASEN